jgi:hypothetical protein
MGLKDIKFISISPIYLVSLITLIILVGIGFYMDYHKYDNHTVLNKEHHIQTEINKMKIDHGVAILNNSIIIPSGTRLKNEDQVIKNNSNLFIELDNPFSIFKKSGSLELAVIKKYDTLIFQIPDPNYKDPNDPTFRDLHDNLFSD